jgi:hypothetical protein
MSKNRGNHQVIQKKNVLIISNNYKNYNKLGKKLKCKYYSYVDYDTGKFNLPIIDEIIIINSKVDEDRWRRILYRKGLSIKISYIDRV